MNITTDILPEKFLESIEENNTASKLHSDPDFGTACFRAAETGATERFKLGMTEITRGILWLEIIRSYDLWKWGGYRSWEQFLTTWIDGGARERTRVRDWLKTTRIWKGIGRPLPDLLRYEEGVATIEPVFEPENGIILPYQEGGYDSLTGQVLALKPEWSGKLGGSTPTEQVNAFIDEIEYTATKTDTRDKLVDEIPAAKFEFLPLYWNGEIVGMNVKFYDATGILDREIDIPCKDMWSTARSLGLENKLLTLLRVPREWRNG